MQHVVTEQAGSAGLITLARPRALNALTLAMIRTCGSAGHPLRHRSAWATKESRDYGR